MNSLFWLFWLASELLEPTCLCSPNTILTGTLGNLGTCTQVFWIFITSAFTYWANSPALRFDISNKFQRDITESRPRSAHWVKYTLGHLHLRLLTHSVLGMKTNRLLTIYHVSQFNDSSLICGHHCPACWSHLKKYFLDICILPFKHLWFSPAAHFLAVICFLNV